MYTLKIETFGGTVTVEAGCINYITRVAESMSLLDKKEVHSLIDQQFDEALKATKPVAKKRGRPAGSRNK